MNVSYKFRKILIKCALIGVLFSSEVFAADVTINVTGKVIASPCTVDNSGTYTVDLGQNISAATLNPASSYSAWKSFNVTLSSCPAGTTKVMASFTGNPDSSNTMYANATGAGYAQNVAVQLQNSGGTNTGNGTSMTVNVTSSTATFPLQARAYSTPGGTTPGNISAAVLMNFTYN